MKLHHAAMIISYISGLEAQAAQKLVRKSHYPLRPDHIRMISNEEYPNQVRRYTENAGFLRRPSLELALEHTQRGLTDWVIKGMETPQLVHKFSEPLRFRIHLVGCLAIVVWDSIEEGPAEKADRKAYSGWTPKSGWSPREFDLETVEFSSTLIRWALNDLRLLVEFAQRYKDSERTQLFEYIDHAFSIWNRKKERLEAAL